MLELLYSMIPTQISCFWFPVKVIVIQILIRVLFSLIFEGLMGPIGIVMGFGLIFAFFGWIFILLTYISSYLFCQYPLYRQILFIGAALTLGYEVIDNILERISSKKNIN